jgi:hypothetical protein
MAMKDFDFKKFMLEKGEKVGLAIAVAVLALLLLSSLFMPGSGLMAESPSKNAEKLKKPTSDARTRLRTKIENPGPDIKKDLPQTDVQADKFVDTSIVMSDFGKFMVAGFFAPAGRPDARRQKPDVYLPADGKIALTRAQIRRWILDEKYEKIMIEEGGTDNNAISEVRNAFLNRNPAAGGRRGGRGNTRPPDPAAGGEGPATGPGEKKFKFVDINELEKANGKPAETILPLRIAVIAGDFPYRAQVEEFRRKLRLASDLAVLEEINENDKTDDPETATGQPSFRFVGVELERRVLDASGKPVADRSAKGNSESWVRVDLEGEFVDYVLLSGGRTEPEDDPQLEQISFLGLVMPRLLQIREKQYPAIESELPKIKSTLAEMKKEANKTISAPVNRFDRRQFNVWSSGNQTNRPPTTNPMGERRPGPGIGTRPPPSREGREPVTEDKNFLPEYCLIRLMDVTIEPGKIYQYRMRVKMANPNYKRTDKAVASDAYAKDPYLTSEEWYTLPQTVAVPPETLYYAVDQKALEGSKYNGINPRDDPTTKQTVIQIHRWVDQLFEKKTDKYVPAGEWVVAERVAVRRGEYVGRPQRVMVPVWKYTLGKFFIPETGKRLGTDMSFAFTNPTSDAVLVDFDNGDATHDRPGGKPIKEKGPTEVLIYTHDGKLISHDSATDGEDQGRTKRLTGWRDRLIETLKGGSKTNDTGPRLGT